MKNIDEIIDRGPVIPVLTFDDVAVGEAVCRALYAGGIKVFEITLRTPVGLEVLERAQHIAPDIQVGIGRVLHADQIAAGKKAGAVFAMSPGFSQNLAQAAQDHDLPLLPGVMTPSEMMVVLEAGYTTVKFFPVVEGHGLSALNYLHASFPTLKFFPSGGITIQSAPHFLALPNVMGVSGSWLAPRALILEGNWSEITHLARQACELGHHRSHQHCKHATALADA